MPSLRRSFEDAYPDVRIRQHEINQGQLLHMLHQGEIDLALTYDLELSQDVDFEPLMQLPAYVMLPEGHILARRDKVTPEDLVDEQMVLLDLPYSREKGLRSRIAQRTGNIAVMRSMVANGFGYGVANMRPLNSVSPMASRSASCFLKAFVPSPWVWPCHIPITGPTRWPNSSTMPADIWLSRPCSWFDHALTSPNTIWRRNPQA